MSTLRKKLEDLNSEVLTTFNELINNNPIITFLTEDEVKNGEFEELFDIIDTDSGLAIEVALIEINEDGIHVIETQGYQNRRKISFYEFNSLADKVNLVELIDTIGFTL